MTAQLVLNPHAVMRIKVGDAGGLRTRLRVYQVLEILRDSRSYVPYHCKSGTGRVFFSKIDQKCLVAWLDDSGDVLKVKTIENHHNRIPLHIQLLAEQCCFGNVIFLNRPPARESLAPEYNALCRFGTNRPPVSLPGYMYPGISWWRFQRNVRNLVKMIHRYDLDGTELISLEAELWHGKKGRYVRWEDKLPLHFPKELLIAGRAGVLPDMNLEYKRPLHKM